MLFLYPFPTFVEDGKLVMADAVERNWLIIRFLSPLAADLIVLDTPFWFNVDRASSRPSFLRATRSERKSKSMMLSTYCDSKEK